LSSYGGSISTSARRDGGGSSAFSAWKPSPRVDQHPLAARANARPAARHARLELAEVIGQQLAVGRVQFEQAQAVLLARDLVGACTANRGSSASCRSGSWP
jgi:hypothetical protein